MDNFFGFRIVENLQKMDKDIQRKQLKYHNKRVMVSKEFTFDAAHHLHCYEGKCKNLHGHTYKVVFGISGYVNEIGLAIDFGDIKEIWKNEIEIYLDHRYLNETLPAMNTTAENMVVWIYEKMAEALTKENRVNEYKGARVEFVRLFETPTSYAEVRREWMLDEENPCLRNIRSDYSR
ncbi:6-carboxytetrahydropterin synthase QueD [Bacillus thuringiensis]|nr:6-carboxytetrahydropterin synthase QueD [Bacillus thuringiensis]AIE32699.1 6-pyruvoyl tetrahydrobiopterin synthase [Bacillus thuringiensis serovar kurstaki str. HD-1]